MSRFYWLLAVAIVVVAALTLWLIGRAPICTCGEVYLWVSEVHGPNNSQHLSDWYTPSHIIHGFLFAGLTWWTMHSRPLGQRFCLALLVESAWEIIENSPLIINRYREATAAFGYAGDSVINSVSDIAAMALGFWLARRIGPWPAVIIGVALELFTLWAIRDNLTLNVVMLVWPIEAIRTWQMGA